MIISPLDITINTYDRTAKEYADNVRYMTPSKELERFLWYVHSGKILDIGCGSGVAARRLQEKGLDVYGIDLSENLLEEAKKESPKSRFFNIDMRDLSVFSSNFFDGVWNVASLLHLEKKDVSIALGEANRVLKPEGIMYLSIKKGEGEGLEKDSRYGDQLKYYAYYGPKEIERFLQDSKFEVLEDYWVEYKDSYRNAHPWMNIFAKKFTGKK